MSLERRPDNLGYTIRWLLKKWKTQEFQSRWQTLDDFLVDWVDIALVDDGVLSEDAKDLKREMLAL